MESGYHNRVRPPRLRPGLWIDLAGILSEMRILAIDLENDLYRFQDLGDGPGFRTRFEALLLERARTVDRLGDRIEALRGSGAPA